MTSYLSESFFVSSRGNLAIYLCLFQIPRLPKKGLKVENKGGTQLSLFCKPLWSYLVVQISNILCSPDPFKKSTEELLSTRLVL